MKKILLLPLALLFTFPLASCNNDKHEPHYNPQEESSVYKLNYENIFLSLDESFQLTLSLNGLPVIATWETSNDNVSVENGLVTGLKIGDSVVTATYEEKSYSCNVKVNLSETIPSLKVNCNKNLVLEKNDVFTLTAEFYWNNEVSKIDNINYILDGDCVSVTKKDNSLNIKAGSKEGTANLIVISLWHDLAIYNEVNITVR